MVFADHGGWVLQASFNPSGRDLITADALGSLRYFPLQMEFYSTNLCSKINRNMTEKEWSNFVGVIFHTRKPVTNEKKMYMDFVRCLDGYNQSLHAQVDCGQTLIQAERAYYTGRFGDVQTLLAACLPVALIKIKKQKLTG